MLKGLRGSCRRQAVAGVIAVALAAAAGPARALIIDLRLGAQAIGILSTEGPVVATAPSGTAGVNFWASRSLAAGVSPLTDADLRWLQRSVFSKPVTGFPDRPFIDPRHGQPIGGGAADAEPWYDVSGPTRSSLSTIGGGDDAWMGDGPYAPRSMAPLEFVAETMVVAIDALRREVVLLGGVRWGYALTAAGATPLGPDPLIADAALRTAVNAALKADFPDWWIVPETRAALLVLSGLAILGVRQRRSVGCALARRRVQPT